jgi:hypothetical protein
MSPLPNIDLALISFCVALSQHHVSNCIAHLFHLHAVAVKDMASNLENRWRSLLDKNPVENGVKKEGKTMEGGSCRSLDP